MKKKLLCLVALLAIVSFAGLVPSAEAQLGGDWCDRYDSGLCDYYTSDDLCCRAIGPGCGPFICW